VTPGREVARLLKIGRWRSCNLLLVVSPRSVLCWDNWRNKVDLGTSQHAVHATLQSYVGIPSVFRRRSAYCCSHLEVSCWLPAIKARVKRWLSPESDVLSSIIVRRYWRPAVGFVGFQKYGHAFRCRKCHHCVLNTGVLDFALSIRLVARPCPHLHLDFDLCSNRHRHLLGP
jgi:hypothetical protein